MRLIWRLAVLALVVSASSVPAQSGKRPNILFAISDDQSFPHASAYGSPFVKTPAFDRVAKNGVLFQNAYAASPGCSPSRAALLTGKHTWQLKHAGTHASSFPRDLRVFTQLLEDGGYFIGYTGKPWGPGNVRITGWKQNPVGPAFSKIKSKKTPKGISATNYAANFKDFLAKRPKGKPFFFWFGGHEPHRAYLDGIGLKQGKKLKSVVVPPFLPDTKEIRSDLLDYAVEIEWFDSHLLRMIEMLAEAGELENTIIVVTADNGMPFPRAKANCYDFGIHVPMAISWPRGVKGGRTVQDLVGFVDLAPTFLEAAGVKIPADIIGKSLLPILRSDKQRWVDPKRDRIFSARERHSSSRVDNLGYPIRAMRKGSFLYIRNFAPERWPAGDPRGFRGASFGYYDIDACPSKTFMVNQAKKYPILFVAAVGKRPAEELFDLSKDTGCMKNLAFDAKNAALVKRLRTEMESYLRETGDPWMSGNGAVFESYPRYSPIRTFK